MPDLSTPQLPREPREQGSQDDASQRQLQAFVDAVAHDLRAPLRSIQSFSRLLEGRLAGQLDATASDHLHRIRHAADRMDGLLAGLAELSQAISAPLRSTRVDLGLLCEWVLAELQDTHPDRPAQVATEGLDGLYVEGDERLLKLALARILDNAWRFTPEQEPVNVTVRGERGGGRVRVQIHDHGSGFDMRYVHKIFEPFQRLHGPEEGAGHGLGLAVAQRAIERHGGGLAAESADVGGATFHLDLPDADEPTDTAT